MSTPTVPARPSRSTATTSAPTQESTPQVPPRPTRKADPSPSRDLRSPLNDMPTLTKTISKPSNLSVGEVPPRPPSVTLPSVGQEGSEYAATYDLLPPEVPGVNNAASAEAAAAPAEQTRNVAEGMTLHAPVASLPQSAAKSKIQTVTRTDSSQAAAAGIGKARPDDDVHRVPADSSTSLDRVPSTDPSSLQGRTSSYNRPPSGAAYGSRPASVYEDFHEQGIPQIGVHTPLNPMAGDVQAPSPGPTQSQHSPGIGFFNDGSSRAHQRKRSGRHEFHNPPGSYGLHSHSLEPHDRFEKEWYEKNKDKAQMEAYNLYRIPKPETALSSAELNRIVTQSDDGTTPNLGTPGDDVGWSASEAYAARGSPKGSPIPTQERERKKRPSSGSQPAIESPLRRTSYGFSKAQQAVDDDDLDVIHIDESEYRDNQGYRRSSANGSADTGSHAGHAIDDGESYVERGGTPILASDEVLKRHESATMHAAVSSDHFDSYDEYAQYDNSRRSSFRAPSRPSSRPGSIHGDTYQGGNLHRFISHEDPHHGSNSHTPLEEIEEYEPLIPEDEVASPKRTSKNKDVKRRPGIEHHHWPSQDIWEDTPSSMYYHTTVQNPEEEKLSPESAAAPRAADTISPQRSDEQDSKAVLSNGQASARPHYASRVVGDRPGPQRFPSRDIWEDTPSSMQYTTTVGGPQMDETKSIPEERSTTSAIPGSQDDADARATTGFSQPHRPSIPARPARRSKLAEEVKPDDEGDAESENLSREVSQEQPPSPSKAKAPPVPDRPKPTVPVRPARTSRSEQTNGTEAEVTKTTSRELPSTSSAEAAKSPPLPKAKPTVPARPGGEKIAALKSGFMSDLNNRLKVGPPAPKSKEVEPDVAEEAAPKAPLADARKGRAKGPARRKPAVSPSSAPTATGAATFSISTPLTIWSIDQREKLQVPSATQEKLPGATAANDALALEKSIEDNAAVNTSEAGPANTAPGPADDLPQLEKVLSDNLVANTEEGTLAEPMSPENDKGKPLSPTISLDDVASAPIEQQKNIQARLEEKLVDVGAAPASLGAGSGKSAEVETSVKDIGVVERREDEGLVGEVVESERKVVAAASKELGGSDNVADDTTVVNSSKAETVAAEEETEGVAAS